MFQVALPTFFPRVVTHLATHWIVVLHLLPLAWNHEALADTPGGSERYTQLSLDKWPPIRCQPNYPTQVLTPTLSPTEASKDRSRSPPRMAAQPASVGIAGLEALQHVLASVLTPRFRTTTP